MSILDTIFKFHYKITESDQSILERIESTESIQEEILAYFKAADYPIITSKTLFFYCVILANSLEENQVNIMDIASSLSVRIADLNQLRYELIINELIEKGFIERRNNNKRNEQRSVSVEFNIYNSILLDKGLEAKNDRIEDINELAIKAKSFLENIESKKISLTFGVQKLKELAQTIESPFVQFIQKYEISDAEYIIIMICLWDYLADPNDHKVSVNRILDDIFSHNDSSKLFKLKQSFLFGNNELLKKNLVEVVNEEEMRSNNFIKLHSRVLDIIRLDSKVSVQQKTFNELTKVEEKDIPTLFYNTKVEAEFQKMKSLLEPDKFKLVLENFEKAQLPSHSNILLYGESGTGKTEMAKSLSVGKMVFSIDVSEWKSMYYGRSQQLVKEHFKKFAKMCEAYPFQCVMILNECDSLLGKRLDNANSSTDETSNAIQSMLLESIEQLPKGSLLIATTNMSNLLDDAFSRRFLFKIHVDLPNYETSFNIWKHYLSGYSDELYSKLGRLGLSGGFISNIAKKVTIDKIILGNDVTENTIYNWAIEETNYNKKANPMGFQKAGKY